MEDVELLARRALVVAQQNYEAAAKSLRDARAAAQSPHDVSAVTSALDASRRALTVARETYHRAAETLKLTLDALSESTVRFERAESALRMARAAAGDPVSARLVADELKRLEQDLDACRESLERAGRRLADMRRSP